MKRFLTYDDWAKNPLEQRDLALAAHYEDTEHRGLLYPGIGLHKDKDLDAQFHAQLSLPPSGELITFFRKYLPKAEQKTLIHNDCQIGTVSAILFLTLPENCRGGIGFWRHKLYGWDRQPGGKEVEAKGLKDDLRLWDSIHQDGFDTVKWEMVDYCPMEFNRLVVFNSGLYHSRWPEEIIGKDIQDCRLIKTFFWKQDAG